MGHTYSSDIVHQYNHSMGVTELLIFICSCLYIKSNTNLRSGTEGYSSVGFIPMDRSKLDPVQASFVKIF